MQVLTHSKKEEIIFEDVSFSYSEEKQVLKNVSFTIRSGETFVIVGQCGFGKSTMLKLCCGLLKPDTGRVILRGRDTRLVSNEELHRLRLDIGYVFQNSALISNLSVTANVALPLRYHTDYSADKISTIVKSRLKLLELDGIESAMPSSLSMGLMKRAAVARALALMPSLMLYDEPTSGLDPLNSASINGIISTLHKGFGVTSVIVSHDIKSTISIASQIALVANKTVAFTGTPNDFISSNNEIVRSFVASTE